MGFNSTAIRFFLSSKPRMGEISSALVIGRQSFTPSLMLLRELKKQGLVANSNRLIYADDFFAAVGIKNLDCLDLSDYQGANILHDLNDPIPAELVSRYDLVIEAGTLEHIPDFLSALRNAMQMVKVGGFLIIIAPGNNFLGHGCYQLSPEIFHRVLSSHQGFEIKSSYIHEEGFLGGKWRDVPDSKTVNSRVSIRTRRATDVCILAQRISLETGKVDHQSDYETLWNQAPQVSKLGKIYLNSPYFVQRLVYILILQWIYATRSKKILRRIKTVGRLRLPQTTNTAP